MSTKEKVSDKLHNLIDKNMDAYKSYLKASDNTKDMHLRDYLRDQAMTRKTFAEELTNCLKDYNPDFDMDTLGSLSGSIRQGWIDLKTLLTGTTDKIILQESTRADRASAEEYQEFVNTCSSQSSSVDAVIKKQLHQILDSLDNQLSLEKGTK